MTAFATKKAALVRQPETFCLKCLLSQIGLEQFALLTLQAATGLFFDLAHALARQVKLGTNHLQRHLLTADTEEHLQDFTLALTELVQRTVHLLGQRLLIQGGVGHG